MVFYLQRGLCQLLITPPPPKPSPTTPPALPIPRVSAVTRRLNTSISIQFFFFQRLFFPLERVIVCFVLFACSERAQRYSPFPVALNSPFFNTRSLCFYDCYFTWIRDVESCIFALKCGPRQKPEPGKSLNLVNFHSRHTPPHFLITTHGPPLSPSSFSFGNACREMNRSPTFPHEVSSQQRSSLPWQSLLFF